MNRVPATSRRDLVPRHRITISPVVTRQASIEAQISLTSALGLQGISLSARQLAGSGQRQNIERIRASALSVELLYVTPRLDLTDCTQWPVYQEELIAGLELGHGLGTRAALVLGGRGIGAPWEKAADAFCTAIGPALTVADDLGIRLLLEATSPQFASVSFIHTFSDAVMIAGRLDLGVVLDYAASWWERGLMSTVEKAVDMIGVVQVADWKAASLSSERLTPGDGDLPLAGFLQGLQATGYRGLIELEPAGHAVDSEGYRPALGRGISYIESILQPPGAIEC